MDRRARLRLWRLTPPFTRAVEVRQISVGGFLDLVRLAAPRAARAIAESPAPLTDEQFIRACADAEVMAGFADLVCHEQPIGFLRAWLHGRFSGAFARRNTAALLAACREVEGDGQWTRFIGCLNRGGEEKGKKAKKADRGGLMADVMTAGAMLHLDPMTVLSWPLQNFLNICESLNLIATAHYKPDPLDDPDAEPADSLGIPGLFEVH